MEQEFVDLKIDTEVFILKMQEARLSSPEEFTNLLNQLSVKLDNLIESAHTVEIAYTQNINSFDDFTSTNEIRFYFEIQEIINNILSDLRSEAPNNFSWNGPLKEIIKQCYNHLANINVLIKAKQLQLLKNYFML